MTGVLLRAERVSRRFGAFTAVQDVTMRVGPGEVVGLLGANGAGKTTLIRMLLGLIATTRGDVALLGGPPDRQRRAWAWRRGRDYHEYWPDAADVPPGSVEVAADLEDVVIALSLLSRLAIGQAS